MAQHIDRTDDGLIMLAPDSSANTHERTTPPLTTNDRRPHEYPHEFSIGTVVDGSKDSAPVCRTRDRMIECTPATFPRELVSPPASATPHPRPATVSAWLMPEGTALRLFFHNHRWRLSTNRRIDAYASRWGATKHARSFGTLFDEALASTVAAHVPHESKDHLFDLVTDRLDRDRVYEFLLQSNEETRVVCRAPGSPRLLLTGIFDRANGFAPLPLELRDQTLAACVPTPRRLAFASVDTLLAYVDQLDHWTHAGVFIPSLNIKVVNNRYAAYAAARGNVPNLVSRRKQLVDQNNPRMLRMFDELYPQTSL